MPSSFAMANPRFRSLQWWRKWIRKDWAVAAVGFTIIVITIALVSDSQSRVDDSKINPAFGVNSNADLVDLTLLRNAKDRGACM